MTHCASDETYLIGILSLVEVNKRSIGHVAGVDEELGTPHGLEEIPRSLKLGHELDEQLCSSVSIDTIHETIDGAGEAVGRRRNAAMSFDRRISSVGKWRDRCATQGSSSRTGLSSTIVGLAVGHHTHTDEHDHQVKDHSKVRQEAQLVKRPDLSQEETHNGPDQAAYDIAKAEFGHLRNRKTIADNEDANADHELQSLKEIDGIAKPRAPDTESKIAVVLCRKLV